MWKWIALYLAGMNLAGFLMMGADKRKAQKGKFRIPEKHLFLVALLGGSIGSILGMYSFRHKTRHKTFVIGMPLILLLQLLLAGCLFYQAMTREATSVSIGMGTVISTDIYGRDSAQAADEIPELVQTLSAESLSWRETGSVLSYLNQQLEAGETCSLDAQEAGWLREALQLCADSGGALDITLRPVLDLWGIESDTPAVPDAAELEQQLAKTDYSAIHISEDGSLSADAPGYSLDLGALGKGIACDEIRTRLQEMKITGAVVSVGGSVLVYGEKPNGGAFRIGIQDPRGDQGTSIGYLEVREDVVISTSGDYEKYFMEDGKRYHHILDPETGYPSDSGLISVTVICQSGIDSDGLSTACFVLGMEESIELLEQYQAEAIFITEEQEVYCTDGIADAFHLESTMYTLE